MAWLCTMHHLHRSLTPYPRLDEAVRLRRHGERRLGYGHLRRGVRAPRSDGVARGIPAGLEGGEFGLLTRGCTGCPPRFSGSCVLVLASSSPVCGASLERPV